MTVEVTPTTGTNGHAAAPGASAMSRAARLRATGLHTVMLPSGVEIVARRVGVMALVQRGLLPDSLTPIVQQMINASQRGGQPTSPEQVAAVVAEIGTLDQVKMTAELWDTTILAIGVD